MESSSGSEVASLSLDLLDKVAAFAAQTAEPFGREFACRDGTERLGGTIALLNAHGDQMLLKRVGRPLAAKKQAFDTNAHRKCIGMFNRADDPSCISSWTFRDPNADPPSYGGGIKLSSGSFLSFSGYPELLDEAYCIHIGATFGLLTQERVSEIVKVSGNTFMDEVENWPGWRDIGN